MESFCTEGPNTDSQQVTWPTKGAKMKSYLGNVIMGISMVCISNFLDYSIKMHCFYMFLFVLSAKKHFFVEKLS